MTGAFAEGGRARDLVIDRRNRGPGFVGPQDPRPKTVLQTKSWAVIVHGLGRGEPAGFREGDVGVEQGNGHLLPASA